jgi:hypothetical protein
MAATSGLSAVRWSARSIHRIASRRRRLDRPIRADLLGGMERSTAGDLTRRA